MRCEGTLVGMWGWQCAPGSAVGETMRGVPRATVYFLLCCSRAGALVPSATLFGPRRGMSGLRRRLGRRVVSSKVDDHRAGIGESEHTLYRR